VLAKLGGSQRFEGEITPERLTASRSAGRFYCPYGDCTQALHGEFKAQPGGSLLVHSRTRKLTVEAQARTRQCVWRRGVWGDEYGGFSYGGAGYGGKPWWKSA